MSKKDVTFTIATSSKADMIFLYKNNNFIVLDYDKSHILNKHLTTNYIDGYLDAYMELDYNVTIKFLEIDIDSEHEYYKNPPKTLAKLKLLSKK